MANGGNEPECGSFSGYEYAYSATRTTPENKYTMEHGWPDTFSDTTAARFVAAGVDVVVTDGLIQWGSVGIYTMEYALAICEEYDLKLYFEVEPVLSTSPTGHYLYDINYPLGVVPEWRTDANCTTDERCRFFHPDDPAEAYDTLQRDGTDMTLGDTVRQLLDDWPDTLVGFCGEAGHYNGMEWLSGVCHDKGARFLFHWMSRMNGGPYIQSGVGSPTAGDYARRLQYCDEISYEFYGRDELWPCIRLFQYIKTEWPDIKVGVNFPIVDFISGGVWHMWAWGPTWASSVPNSGHSYTEQKSMVAAYMRAIKLNVDYDFLEPEWSSSQSDPVDTLDFCNDLDLLAPSRGTDELITYASEV